MLLFPTTAFDGIGITRPALAVDIATRGHPQAGFFFAPLRTSCPSLLDRGKAYSVRLVAGSESIDAKALAETKGITVALADRPFNEKLRSANVLEVRGEGATIRIPLDGSAAAFERLEACFDKNEHTSVETNPFVAPNKKP